MKRMLKQIAIANTNARAAAIINYLHRFNLLYHIQYIDNKNFNIIVDINKKCKKLFESADDKTIFSAHYDVVSGSTGANDNASSIVILLCLARRIKNKPIQIAFFCGEERGGIGSRAYIEEYITGYEKVKYSVVNLDVCGCGDQIVIVNNLYEDTKAYKLYNLKDKYSILESPSFPFSDAEIFKRRDIATYSISVFPQGDIDILLGKTKGHFSSFVWEYMHNGQYDDIKYINYKIMKKVYKYIKNILKA